MAGKRVLGDDPFAAGEASPLDAAKGEATPRASRRPPASKEAKEAKAAVEKAAKPSKKPAAKRASVSPVPREPSPNVEANVEANIEVPVEANPADAGALFLEGDALRAPAVPREARAFARSAEAGDARHDEGGGDVEAQLEALIARAKGDEGAALVLRRVRERLGVSQAEDSSKGAGPELAQDSAERALAARHERAGELDIDGAREVLGTEFYRRHWGRSAMRDREEEVDDFGLDPKFSARVRPMFDFMYERWWRVEARGVDRVPERGAVILCANHAGAVPYDGVMLSAALRREHAGRRELRWLAEDFVFHAPFLGVFMNRVGAVRACQENAARLISKGACVGVFPEGIKGISKPYAERYKLQRFGRGGHVKLAMRTNTTIVPVAIVGAEETHPMIAPSRFLGAAAGLPFLPMTPTFPWLGPLGLIPLPSKWTISFLEPISMSEYGRAGADDEALVGRVNERIRGAIQEELDRIVSSRTSAFRG